MKDYVFRPKFFTLLQQGISRRQLQQDIAAGVIVGIVALPLAIAFAVASGVSPEKGLMTAVVAGFVISLLGGSRVQIGGPTGAFIVVVYGVVSQYGMEGLLISTLLAGIMLVGFGLLRLGSVLKFIPHPLIVGFTSGIAVVIFSTQINDAFGMGISNLPAGFIAKWSTYGANISQTNLWSLGITLLTMGVILFSRKITSRIPGTFIALIITTLLVVFFKLPVPTIETVFGAIPSTFSFDLPAIDLNNIPKYLAPAFTIAFLGAIESLLSAVVADGMIGTSHRSNTELIGQGIANILSPLMGGIPATGAIARTVTNIKSGGRTPVAGIVHALTVLLIMLFLGNYAKLIPMSCLAGILIIIAYNMSEWRSFRSILRGYRYDIAILLTTFFLTVLVDLTVAIQIGIVLASLLFMQRMSKASHIMQLESDDDLLENYDAIPKEIEIYEISGPFFFAAAKKYREVLQNIHQRSSIIIIRMRHVSFIDATGIHNFRETILDIQGSGKKVILSGVRPDVMHELEKSRLAFMIGKGNIFGHFDQAIEKALHLVETKQENNE
ncbi:MAG: SulP family inorganic anion transporter [Bacteroidales bacterium]